MSVVSSVVLVCSLCPDDEATAIDAINAWLEERNQPPLAEISDHAAGRKAMQVNLFAGAYNWLDEDAFIKFVMQQDWDEPEELALVVTPEEGEVRVFSQASRWAFGVPSDRALKDRILCDPWW